MKKKILTIIVLILTMPIFAQTDGYFMYEDDNDIKGGATGTTRSGSATFPIGVGSGFGIAGMNEQVTEVPLGSGLLLLTGAGLAYALLKRKEEETK